MVGMRTVTELIDTPDPAWPDLAEEFAACPVPIEVLPVADAAAQECLYRLQVTARSRLGAMALHTGGVLVEHGWLRLLGGGHPDRELPSLADANRLGAAGPGPQTVLVGHDILGGRFELTGPDPEAAGRPGEPGQVCYFAPDTLEWECLGFGYGVWLSWIAAGRTPDFYESLRWPGWEAESRALRLSQGISVFPYLWSTQARADLAATARAPVPIVELFDRQSEMARTLSGLPSGTRVQVRVVNSGEDAG
jgi:hypothetical protein